MKVGNLSSTILNTTLSGYKKQSTQIKINKDINNLTIKPKHYQATSLITRNTRKNIIPNFNPYHMYTNSARNATKNKFYLSTDPSKHHHQTKTNISSTKVNLPHIYSGNNSFQTTKPKHTSSKVLHTYTTIINETKKSFQYNKDLSYYNNNNKSISKDKTHTKSIKAISLTIPKKKPLIAKIASTVTNKHNRGNSGSNSNSNNGRTMLVMDNSSNSNCNSYRCALTLDTKIEIKCKNAENCITTPSNNNITTNVNEDLHFMLNNKSTHFIQTKPGIDGAGNTKTNQDNHIYLENIFNITNFDIFGVLDGHGKHGHIVSTFVSNYIKSYFTDIKTYTTTKIHQTEPSKEQEPPLTLNDIIHSFTKQNYSLLHTLYNKIDLELTHQHFDVNFSGTTCVMVYHIGSKLIISNIGDSRAIIIKQHNNTYHSEYLSNDHKPGISKEKKRIEAKGGVVKCCDNEIQNNIHSIYRIWMKGEKYPGIAISRTLGDQIAKTIGVINTPEINEIDLTGNECFIIVASDGIWEFLSNDRVKDIVLPFYIKNDPQGAVNSLISLATIEWDNDGSARDDITCIAYFFQRKEQQQQQQQQQHTHTYYKYNNMYYYNDTYW